MNLTITKTRITKMALAAMIFAITLLAFTLPLSAHAEPVADDETQAIVTFEAGSLTIGSAPILNFGTNNISSAVDTIEATTVSEPVQVSDLRGSGEGWNLNVSLSPFIHSDGTTETLQGASIQIDKSTVSGANETVGNTPTVPADLEITADNTETPVFIAETGHGMGVWEIEWEATDVDLIVYPGTAHIGTNTATLTWSLQTAP